MTMNNQPVTDEEDQLQPPTQEVDMTEAGPSDLPEEQTENGELKICLLVKGRQAYSVYIDQGNQSANQGQDFTTAHDALREILRLIKENPRSNDTAENQMQAGFGSTDQKY